MNNRIVVTGRSSTGLYSLWLWGDVIDWVKLSPGPTPTLNGITDYYLSFWVTTGWPKFEIRPDNPL